MGVEVCDRFLGWVWWKDGEVTDPRGACRADVYSAHGIRSACVCDWLAPERYEQAKP